MSTTIVLDKEKWKTKSEFLQSWEYGDFLISTGREMLRLELGEGENIQQFQCVVNKLSLGMGFVYIPRAEITQTNFEELLTYFKDKKFTFVRFELTTEVLSNRYKSLIVQNRQPHHTWIVDVNKDVDVLLKEMHAKTRYNIGLAQKKGVQIDHTKDLDLFWSLNTITTQRNEYKSHPKKYIAELLKLENVYQVNAFFDTTPLASAILLKYEKTLIYFFGASSNEYRNLMAPYLLHFKIIKLAQELGCSSYDFWGIAPPSKSGTGKESCYHNYCWIADHPLTGVSRFKAGFGGELKSYPDAREYVLDPIKYLIFSTIQKFRKQGIVGHPITRNSETK